GYVDSGTSPASIAGGPLLWLKADDLALSDGDPVTSWTDSSGNGWVFEAPGGNEPIYKTNLYNGHATVRIDADNIVGTADDFADLRGGHFTLFFAYLPTDSNRYPKIFEIQNYARDPGVRITIRGPGWDGCPEAIIRSSDYDPETGNMSWTPNWYVCDFQFGELGCVTAPLCLMLFITEFN
ncbi:hypothetical protein ACFLZY_03220, partial [Patescibacteria group bacterium]